MLAIAFASVILGGVAQAALGAARLGTAIKFVPYPVIAGFRNGLAVLIALAQIPPLFGLSHPLTAYDWLALRNTALPWNVLVGVVAASAVFAARALGMKAFAPLLGIAAGTLTHYALQRVLPHDSLGAARRHAPAIELLPAGLSTDARRPRKPAWRRARTVLLAATGHRRRGLDAVAARRARRRRHHRHASRQQPRADRPGPWQCGVRLLRRRTGCRLAIDKRCQLSGRRPDANLRRIGSLLQLTPEPRIELIATLPLAALAGVMLPVAADVADRWSLRLLLRRRDTFARRRELAGDLVIVGIVAVVTVTGESGRRRTRRPADHRRRLRSEDQQACRAPRLLGRPSSLAAAAKRGADGGTPGTGFVHHRLRAQGPLFFGTAGPVSRGSRVANAGFALRGARFPARERAGCDGDASPPATRAQRRAARRNAHVRRHRLGQHHAAHGRRHARSDASPEIHWFVDSDRALEWCEDQLLHVHAPESGAQPSSRSRRPTLQRLHARGDRTASTRSYGERATCADRSCSAAATWAQRCTSS